MSGVGAAIAALRRGGLAVLPTDTVYGLVAYGLSKAAATELYAAKGRESRQPTALLLASLDLLPLALPGLPTSALRAAQALLPGPFTLVLPNPDRRFPWLTGERPEALGVRVPVLRGPAQAVLAELELLVATSANLPGGADPRVVEDVPAEIRKVAGAVVDGGPLPGTPSTVVDLTGAGPVILREGAVPVAEVLERLAGLTDR